MPTWPKDKLLKHGPDLPMEERIRRYQHNIRTIRESGCKVPTSAYIDTLDPAEIELWFANKAFIIDRLNGSPRMLPICRKGRCCHRHLSLSESSSEPASGRTKVHRGDPRRHRHSPALLKTRRGYYNMSESVTAIRRRDISAEFLDRPVNGDT